MDGQGVLPEAFVGWHQIQESLSRLTGLEFAVYDGGGRPLGLVSGESAFCRVIRRKGKDSSFCEEECGKFIREAAGKPDVQVLKCRCGQTVIALSLCSDSVGKLVIAGGKTFSTKDDYNTALDIIKKEGGRLALTGRHKYRFIGKKRLYEAVRLVKSAAAQHFDTSYQKFKYQLKHNRQVALLENTVLLYHEKELPELAESLLKCISALYEAGTASFIICSGRGCESNRHFVHGVDEKVVGTAEVKNFEKLLALHQGRAETYSTADHTELEALGLPQRIVSLTSISFKSSGEMNGLVNIYNAGVGTEDMPALQACIRQVAAVIENKKLKEEVKEKIKGLKDIVESNAQLVTLRDTEEIFSFIFERSVELLKAEKGSLMLLNEKTDELMVKVSKGLSLEMTDSLRLKAGEGIAGWVAAAGTPIVVEDIENDGRLSLKKRPQYKTKSFMSLPLKAEGRVIGVINLSDKASGEVFSQGDLDIVSGLASQAAISLERAIFSERIEALRMVSIKDQLTGLLNWRYFNDRVTEEVDRSKRYAHPFTLLLIDIDDFKLYNKEAGRQAGDEALKYISALLRASLRSNDILARYGDEEFTLLLPETGLENAVPLAERVRQTVGSVEMPGGGRLTVSIGVASYPEDGKDLKTLFGNAYKAVCQAKESGKDKVVTCRRAE